jgi:hypothetical protein
MNEPIYGSDVLRLPNAERLSVSRLSGLLRSQSKG